MFESKMLRYFDRRDHIRTFVLCNRKAGRIVVLTLGLHILLVLSAILIASDRIHRVVFGSSYNFSKFIVYAPACARMAVALIWFPQFNQRMKPLPMQKRSARGDVVGRRPPYSRTRAIDGSPVQHAGIQAGTISVVLE